MTRKVYASLDVAKFIMAIMILLGHTANEWAHTVGIWHYVLSFDFTVPTFFAISGFLFFSKIKEMTSRSERTHYWLKWSIHIGRMYLVWTLVYFAFILFNWIRHGIETADVLLWVMHSFTWSSYSTIWFLPSLWVGVTICWLLVENIEKKIWVYGIISILFVIGVLMDPYKVFVVDAPLVSEINDVYTFFFLTYRNGVFYGAPYALLGYIVIHRKSIPNLVKSGSGIVVFQSLFVVEAILMKIINPISNTDMAIMMFPSVYFILLFLLNIDIKSNYFTVLLRKFSMLIFLGQRLFLTAIPSVWPKSYTVFIQSLSQIEIYLYFGLTTMAFAIVIELLSRRIHFLNYLM